MPGPRANLELIAAVAEEGDAVYFDHCLSFDRPDLPANTATDYLILCGIVGHGNLVVKGNRAALPILRRYASDGRWRMREGVALGLQYWGMVDMPALINEMQEWGKGNLYEQRAAAAALCEPKLLKQEAEVVRVLQILDVITAAIPTITSHSKERKRDDFVALRKGLGYCWSVAVAAAPVPGKAMITPWLSSNDPDIRWIMRENLNKHRLTRMDAAWVAQAQQQLAAG